MQKSGGAEIKHQPFFVRAFIDCVPKRGMQSEPRFHIFLSVSFLVFPLCIFPGLGPAHREAALLVNLPRFCATQITRSHRDLTRFLANLMRTLPHVSERVQKSPINLQFLAARGRFAGQFANTRSRSLVRLTSRDLSRDYACTDSTFAAQSASREIC